ncbi:hypothetical protein DL769_006830 [Monosporascus sp. CRB-8-3]|nr:hypothetical protein DL769_006830 [Monosporascus sp. CRB-8-3]
MHLKILSTIFFLWGLSLHTTLAGSVSKQLSTLSWGPTGVHSFSLHANSLIYHIWWNGSSWEWEILPVSGWSSLPEAVSWGPNHIDLFALGRENSCYHTSWDGNSWSDWQNLGGYFTSSIKAVTWGPGRIDLFGRGADMAGWHTWWDGSGWAEWVTLGGDPILGGWLNSGVEAVSRDANRLDIFALGTDNTCLHKSWNGSWTGVAGNPWAVQS